MHPAPREEAQVLFHRAVHDQPVHAPTTRHGHALRIHVNGKHPIALTSWRPQVIQQAHSLTSQPHHDAEPAPVKKTHRRPLQEERGAQEKIPRQPTEQAEKSATAEQQREPAPTL